MREPSQRASGSWSSRSAPPPEPPPFQPDYSLITHIEKSRQPRAPRPYRHPRPLSAKELTHALSIYGKAPLLPPGTTSDPPAVGTPKASIPTPTGTGGRLTENFPAGPPSPLATPATPSPFELATEALTALAAYLISAGQRSLRSLRSRWGSSR